LSNNSDVKLSGANPLKHFLLFGGFEGRSPSDKFDSNYYIDNNPDVLDSGMNPLLHFLKYGVKEGREASYKNLKLFATSDDEKIILNNLKSYPLDRSDFKPKLVAKNIPVHTAMVDIIICIHNAVEDVKKCLSSIIRFTTQPYRLILIDDGSEEETKGWVNEFSSIHGCNLIRNEIAHGYTKSANQGINISSSPYLLLLNSDTIVGNIEWLDRLVLCIQKDEKTGVVSPLSNTASWQSIPKVFSGEDWAENLIPDGFSIEQMANMVSEDSICIYPEIPFLNGFCLLFKRECIDSVGSFDEHSFPDGYGEENDFCIRAIKKNWRLAISDDVYIYHSQSKSYSHSKRLRLSKNAGVFLEKKHGNSIISTGVEKCRNNLALHSFRSRSIHYAALNEAQKTCRTNYSSKKILFVLPVAQLGGGANIVMSEVKAMREMQIDCYIANTLEYKGLFEQNYSTNDVPIIYFDSPNDLSDKLDYFDVIIATAYSSMEWIKTAITIKKSKIIVGYYIQDFEPYFFPESSNLRKKALESYKLITDAKCFTKTKWNQTEIKNQIGITPEIVSPSLNLDIFRPHHNKSFNEKILITAMVRPDTPRRAPEMTLKVLEKVKKKYGSIVEIYTFGCEPSETIISSYEKKFKFIHLGIQSSTDLAILFNMSHIFIDMSQFQAMGLTGMEAMACANAVILPVSGGADTFVERYQNGFLVDTETEDECLNVVDTLINDRNLLSKTAYQALKDICQYSPYFSAHNILNCLFSTNNN